MSEATSEHSAQPITADSGWRNIKRQLVHTIPSRMRATSQARRGIRKLARRR